MKETAAKLAEKAKQSRVVALDKSKELGKVAAVKGKAMAVSAAAVTSEKAKVVAVKSKEQGLIFWQKFKMILVPLLIKFMVFYRKEVIAYLGKLAKDSDHKVDDLAVYGFKHVLDILAEEQEKKDAAKEKNEES